ncbi:hypothetical protein CHS0354_010078 [Potamilus streckersoni]|uniref:Uncharacterized protein n=1 Tax=Potamilus streckersoni TaxID=2493646 RepID=A0AAE0VH70_9BIVA|nr:hypothetical protein CHS0354_010078 [Potamilus streckersoni]
MHRHTMRPMSMSSVVAVKPPKPPCWQDFVIQTQSVSNINEADLADIQKIAKSSGGCPNADSLTSNKTGKTKRIRAKIHRTRSQFMIEEADLPEGTLTVSLADTKPGDLGFRKPQILDERVIREDNNRKCQNWLQSIEACKPLEDIDQSDNDSEELDCEGVAIEIPDDTLWDDQRELRPTNDAKIVSSDSEAHKGQRSRLLHKSKSYDSKHEKASNSKGKCLGTSSLSGSISSHLKIKHI